jgi:macrolide transport system ATP-binding/permease protein
MLMILSSVVLLIACANIANLLLARGTTRRAELAVRMALGAARARLIRQILTQSVLLSLIGGAAGLAVAYALSHMILVLAFPQARNMPVQASPSLPVLGFAFLVSLLTRIIFGTAPAWLSSHAKPAEALRGATALSATSLPFPRRPWLFFKSPCRWFCFRELFSWPSRSPTSSIRTSASPQPIVTSCEFDPQGAGYTLERLPALYRQMEDRLLRIALAVNVSLARYTPLDGNAWGTCVVQQGHPAPGPGDKCFSSWVRVSNRFLQSIGVPIVRGRNFSAQDTQASTPVVLVNQSFARRFFPNQDPIGKHFGLVSPKNSGAFEIAGVFADFKMSIPRGEVTPLFLRPLAQQYLGYTDPEAISSERAPCSSAPSSSSSQPAAGRRGYAAPGTGRDRSQSHRLLFRFIRFPSCRNFNQDRLIARLTSLFGVLALTLASVGLYGVVSFSRGPADQRNRNSHGDGRFPLRASFPWCCAARFGNFCLESLWGSPPRFMPVTSFPACFMR